MKRVDSGPFIGYTQPQIAEMREILVRESQREVMRKKGIMMPAFFERMGREYGIPYRVTFAVFHSLGFIHPAVTFDEFMRRNGLYKEREGD